MELGEGFDPFSSVQPVADWFNPPYGDVESAKALDLHKKSAKHIIFGEAPLLLHVAIRNIAQLAK